MTLPPIFREIRQIVRSRRIISYLIHQEIRTAHRDKLLGNVWMLLDPLLMMMVLFLVFRNIRHTNASFCLYLLSGLLAWDIFTKSITGSTNCLRANRGVVKKFPLSLAIFPVYIVLHKIHDVVWGLSAYMLIFVGIRLLSTEALPTPWQVVLLPVWLFFFLLMTLGLCYIVAAIGVFFRDMNDIVSILLRLQFFISPVFIKVQASFPAHLHKLYFLINPLAGFLIYLRMLLPGGDVLIDGYQIPLRFYPFYLVGMAVICFFAGLMLFMKGQRHYTKYL